MERLTKFDTMRNCYVMRPDARQGDNIQRLGRYEDRDEVCIPYFDHKDENGSVILRCGSCDRIVPEIKDDLYSFCPWCGQRLQEEKENEAGQ